MSKITPKNLHYDTTLPPFLARMQANHSDRGGRHEFDVARPRKQRDADADAEDEPVYFDEVTGESLTKGEWEEREKGKEEGEEKGGEKGEEKESGERVRRENMAVIGGVKKKRKMGKVIGGEEDGEDGEAGEKKTPKDDQSKKSEKGKAAKKGKKIKLSFGDDE